MLETPSVDKLAKGVPILPDTLVEGMVVDLDSKEVLKTSVLECTGDVISLVFVVSRVERIVGGDDVICPPG